MRALYALYVAVAVPALAGCATDGKEDPETQILSLAKEIPPNAVLSLAVLLTGAVMTFAGLDSTLRRSREDDVPEVTPEITGGKADAPEAVR